MSDIQVTLGDEQPINISFETGDVIGSAQWGTVQGDLSDQTDLVAALAEKANTTDLADVATSGNYNDLVNIPAPIEPPVTSVNDKQGDVVLDANDVGADTAGSASQALSEANEYTDEQIGDLATVASTGSYNDLLNKPTIPNITGKADITYVDAQDASLQSNINAKVDRVTGKQLTTEDFTSAAKTKLDGIAAGAQVNPDPATLPVSTATQAALGGKLDKGTMSGAAYVRNVGDIDTQVPYTQSPYATSLVQYATGGQVRAATATLSDAAVPLAQLNTYIQRGTGFPNGVVSAPVGSIYIDTAVTNGASSWIKKSGTGNTGWQVLEGDTGWRNITSLLEAGALAGGQVHIRMIGNQIYLNSINSTLNSGGGSLVILINIGTKLGESYRPFENTVDIVSINSSAAIFRYMAYQPAPSGGFVYYGPAGNGYWCSKYAGKGGWPTTLPGTAV